MESRPICRMGKEMISTLSNFLKWVLNWNTATLEKRTRLYALHRLFFLNTLAPLFFLPLNLNTIGLIARTDKARGHDHSHSYLPIYEKHFRKLRFRQINIFEIGVGGYEKHKIGG